MVAVRQAALGCGGTGDGRVTRTGPERQLQSGLKDLFSEHIARPHLIGPGRALSSLPGLPDAEEGLDRPLDKRNALEKHQVAQVLKPGRRQLRVAIRKDLPDDGCQVVVAVVQVVSFWTWNGFGDVVTKFILSCIVTAHGAMLAPWVAKAWVKLWNPKRTDSA